MEDYLPRREESEVDFRKSAVLIFALCLLLGAGAIVSAEEADEVKAVAVQYVTHVARGEVSDAAGLVYGAALSWVEYLGASEGEDPGYSETVGVELEAMGSRPEDLYYIVKVVYKDGAQRLRVYYVKIRKVDGAWRIVDDGADTRSWVSSRYITGHFAKPDEALGIRVTVLGILALDRELKFDILLENTSKDQARAVYPTLEAYYTIQGPAISRVTFRPKHIKTDFDGVLAPGQSKRGFIVFPNFNAFPELANGLAEGIEWKLHIPVGVKDQVVIFQ